MFKNLSSLLNDRKISNDEFAKLLGIHRNTLTSKLQGDSQFTLDEIDTIMIVFKEYKFDYIFAREQKSAS